MSNKKIIDDKVMYSFYNACEEFLKECSSNIEYTPSSTSGGNNSTSGGTSSTSGGNNSTSGGTSSTSGGTSSTSGGIPPVASTDAKKVKSIKLSPVKQSIDIDKVIVGSKQRYSKLTPVVGAGFEKKFLFDVNAEMSTDSFIEEMLKKIAAKHSDGTLALVESGGILKLKDAISGSFTYKNSTKEITADYSVNIFIKKENTNTQTVLRIALTKPNTELKGTVSLYMHEMIKNFNVDWE